MTLAVASYGVGAIAVDGSSVYWIDPSENTITKVPLGGGAPSTLVRDLTTPWGIAIDASSVYWTDDGVSSGAGTVTKVALSGGTPTTLATNQGGPLGIAVDANGVYWVNSESGTVMRATAQ